MSDQIGRPYYMTLDHDKKTGFFKSAGGTPIWGSIIAADDVQTLMVLPRGGPPDFHLIWNAPARTLTWLGVLNDPERRRVVSSCEIVDAPAK
jgi:hypothetical protein